MEIYRDVAEQPDILEYMNNHDSLSVFQSRFYLDLCQRTEGQEGMLLVCRKDKEITGLLLAQLQNNFGKSLRKLASRALVIGGPVASSEDAESGNALIKSYIEFIKDKAVYTQIRCLFQNSYADKLFEGNGYTRNDHLNYVIDLKKGEEECWKKLHSKRRNEVRKAVKEGITFSEIDYKNESVDAYNVLKKIYGRAKLPLPGYEYFSTALEIMGNDGIFRIFGGYYEGKLVGVMYVLCFKGIVYDWYAGSYDEYLKKCPNDLITWEVIKWSILNNYSVFDFGGAGSPGKEYGVRDFKKKFGGDELNTGRYEIIHKPSVMKISKAGFRIWQKIQKVK